MKASIENINGNNFSWLNEFSMINDNSSTYYYVVDYGLGEISMFDDNWSFINYSKSYLAPQNIVSVNNELFITSYSNIYKADKYLNKINQFDAIDTPNYCGIYHNKTNNLLYVAAFDNKAIYLFDLKLNLVESINLSMYQYPYSIQGFNNHLYVGTFNGVVLVISNKMIIKTFNGCNGCSNYITSITFDRFGFIGISSGNRNGYLHYPNGTLTEKVLTVDHDIQYMRFDSKNRLVVLTREKISIFF